MQWINWINVGKQLLFQPLTFLPCIPNCLIISLWLYLIVSLISFDGRQTRFITVNSLGLVGSKISKIMQCVLKTANEWRSFLSPFWYFTVDAKIFCWIIGILKGSDPTPFFENLFLYIYGSMLMNDLEKNNLIKPRQLSNTFMFIDDLNWINDGVEFEIHYCTIEELKLGKENNDKHEASFLDLDIKIRDGKFQVGHFDKRDLISFYCPEFFLQLVRNH